MQEIIIANPRAKNVVIRRIGTAHNILIENGEPTTALITIKTIIVGKNLKSAITTEESGNMIRGMLCESVVHEALILNARQ